MMQIVKCTQCGTESGLCIDFKFDVETKSCSECHEIKVTSWDFNFCSFGCFLAWFESAKMRGLPCQDCYGTGYAFGVQSNGECKRCKETKFFQIAIR